MYLATLHRYFYFYLRHYPFLKLLQNIGSKWKWIRHFTYIRSTHVNGSQIPIANLRIRRTGIWRESRNVSHLTGVICRCRQYPLGQPTRRVICGCPRCTRGRVASSQCQPAGQCDRDSPGMGCRTPHGFAGRSEVVVGVMPEKKLNRS